LLKLRKKQIETYFQLTERTEQTEATLICCNSGGE